MSRRHLDSNIIRLQANSRIEAHAGPDRDVLLHILNGDGWLVTEISTLTLTSRRRSGFRASLAERSLLARRG
jgi:hypothetical protein